MNACFFDRYSNGEIGFCHGNTDGVEQNCYEAFNTTEKRKMSEEIWFTAYCSTQYSSAGTLEVMYPVEYFFRNSDFRLLKVHDYRVLLSDYHRLGLGGGLKSDGSGMEVGHCGHWCNKKWTNPTVIVHDEHK